MRETYNVVVIRNTIKVIPEAIGKGSSPDNLLLLLSSITTSRAIVKIIYHHPDRFKSWDLLIQQLNIPMNVMTIKGKRNTIDRMDDRMEILIGGV